MEAPLNSLLLKHNSKSCAVFKNDNPCLLQVFYRICVDLPRFIQLSFHIKAVDA